MTHRKHSFLRHVAMIMVFSMFLSIPTASAMDIEDLMAEMILYYLFGDALYEDGGLDAYRDSEYGWLEYPSDSEYPIYIDEQTGYLFGMYTDNTAYISGHLDFAYSSPQQKMDLYIPATVMGVPVDGVDEGAFANNDCIGHVYVAEGVRSIGVGAFEGSSITGITLPSTLRNIEDEAFEGCQSLGNVTLPEGLLFIGNSAFSLCPGITRVIIPDSVTDIRFDAFFGCANLESVHIGSGLNTLEGNVFSLSPRLKTLTLSNQNSTFYMQDGILYNRYKHSIVRYPGMNRQDVVFTVPNGITCVEDSCFADENTLRQVFLPDSVTTIEDYAFYGCGQCTLFDLGAGVVSIGDTAIPINQLRGIQLPDSLISIEELSLFSFTDKAFAYGSFWVLANDGSHAAIWARQQGCEVYSPTEDMLIAIGASSRKAEAMEEAAPHLHDYANQVTLSPTCVNPGKAQYVCSICGDSYTEVIPAERHEIIISTVHPHKDASCNKCGERIADNQNEARILSDCASCFPQGSYTEERATEMAQICLNTYHLKAFFGDKYNDKTFHHIMPNAYGIGDDEQKGLDSDFNGVEVLFLIDITDDGELILTISLQGSMDRDDWLADVLQTEADAEGIHYKFNEFVRKLITETIEGDKTKIPVHLEKNGHSLEKEEYTLKELLEMVKNSDNAHLRITGHSMGGSLAQILTYRLINNYYISPKKIETYTFAALPPFTKYIAGMFDKAYPNANIYNFIHTKDFAPDVGVTYRTDPFGDGPDYFPLVSFCLTVGIPTDTKVKVGNIRQTVANFFLSGNGGETLTGNDIGKKILLNSELNFPEYHPLHPRLHDMSVYRDLVQNIDAYRIDNFKNAQKACEKYLETFECVADVYGTAVKINGSWYTDNTLLLYNYHELLWEWNNICESIKKSDPRIEDVGLLKRDILIGSGFAGERMTENGRTPLYGKEVNEIYSIDVIENFITTKSEEYNRIFRK